MEETCAYVSNEVNADLTMEESFSDISDEGYSDFSAEETCADGVSNELKAELTLEETCASNISNDVNADLAKEGTNADKSCMVATAGHSGYVDLNSPISYTHTEDAPMEIFHNYYRFSYDLVEKILQIRGQLNTNITHCLPEPPNYLFTQTHANIVKSFLETDATYLLQEIRNLSNDVYDTHNYLKCRYFFVRGWKNRDYSERTFICACASLAYVAAHFEHHNYNCYALDDVVAFIANWIKDILKRGTIDNSCW